MGDDGSLESHNQAAAQGVELDHLSDSSTGPIQDQLLSADSEKTAVVPVPDESRMDVNTMDSVVHTYRLHFDEATQFTRSRPYASTFPGKNVYTTPAAVWSGTSSAFDNHREDSQSNSLYQRKPHIDSADKLPEEFDFRSYGGFVARNSQFHGLNENERQRLGGHEYRAVALLSWLVPTYLILWQLFGSIGCAAWVAVNRPNTATANGLNPWWVGAFNAVSAFNNSGMSLLDANMTAFQTAYYLLVTMGALILVGNTCYPIVLRLIVWCMYKVASRLESRNERWAQRARTLRFLLDHPRRCYTNLFPARHTWWLLFSVVTLNSIDWAGFEILNIGNSALDLPAGVRTIDGLFQALAVRSGGFYIVSIPSLRISLQVLYVVMMYISVYPVTITIRNSNVYEERSLGIYAEDDHEGDMNAGAQDPHMPLWKRPTRVLSSLSSHFVTGGADTRTDSNRQFLRQQLRAQLAHDAWLIVLALFLIMIIEAGQFESNPMTFSVFNFLFEIVSAYGCVGISVGLPGVDYSFCGAWHVLSKLILCVVMLRGRHRGLPVAIDKAILLPGEENARAEEDDGRIRRERTQSRSRPREETV